VLEDHEGALWLGFGGVGIVRWPGRHQWSAWTRDQGLPDDTVWQSARDREGRLWVGTSNGVGIWDPQTRTWRVLTEEDGIAGPGVWQMAEGQDGRMWTISRMGELTRYDPVTLEPEKVPVPGVEDGRMSRLTGGPDGTLWVSSYEHLFTVTLREGQMVFEPVAFPPEVSGCTKIVSVAPDGVVWTGGPAGLARFDGASWRHFSDRDGLRLNQLDFMVAPSGGDVWFVYQDLVGVAHLRLADDGPQIRHFGTAQGLPSNTVYSLGLDAMGRLWAGGNAGLVVLGHDGPIRVFNRNDGLIWDDLSSHSFLAEPDGSFFVGTSRGLAHFTPSAAVMEEKPPNVVITSAVLGGRERIGDGDVEVGYDERTFIVRYSGLTFRDPAAVRFRYRLVGLEEEFQETAMRELRYPTLTAGSYRFEVLCRSASGLWSDRPAVFSFVVRPAWWGAWWTRACAVLLLCILVASVVWLSTRKLEADRRRLEAAVEERNAELARANRELEEMSYTDALTRTRNRRYFMTVILDEVARVMRLYDERTEDESERNRDLVFYIVDIDWFKKVNDEHGHKAGDRVLSQVAGRINSALRQSDLLVRWGGEEFLIMCRDSEPSEGSGVARRILEAVGGAPFDLGGGGTIVRSCSVGWAPFPWFAAATDVVSFETVIELADRALYLAKESGRDRAVGVLPLVREPRAGEPASWLARPLAELEGKHVRLVRDLGPTVRASDPRT
jgi:diguanylate cyclase (GGDEF)-like protein